MAFVLTSGITQSSLEDLLKMLAIILPADSILPQTKYLFNKHFSKKSFSLNFYCPTCYTLLGEQLTCDNCEEEFSRKKLCDDQSYFLSVSLESQLRHVVERMQIGKHLDYRNNRDTQPNSVCDIYDGKMYRDLLHSTNLSNDYAMSLCFNSDGVPVFDSSSFSIWPILSTINELPPLMRKKNVLLTGLWFGCTKPVFATFFKPLVDEIRDLSANGFQWMLNSTTCITSYVYCVLCSCDSVARAVMQNIKQFNGEFGCNWCLHPGERVDKGRGTVQVYPAGQSHELRTHDTMIQDARLAHQLKTIVSGVKGPSIFMLLPNFDLVNGFVVDPMHALDLGVVRQICSLWFDSCHHAMPWYIGNSIPQIDKKMICVHPPSNITRCPRSLKTRAFWKASEWKYFLILYAPIVLKGILPSKFYRHLLLLSNSAFVLLKENITQLELFHVSQYFQVFVEDFEKLYGKPNMSFNVHLLLHITESVRNWGPFWCFSAYTFENYNGCLLKMFHGTQSVPLQIVNSITRLRDIDSLALSTMPRAPDGVSKVFCELLDGVCDVKKFCRWQDVVYFGVGKIISLSLYEKSAIELILRKSVSENAEVYQRALIGDQVYNSANYSLNKIRNNSFSMVNNMQPVQIKCFVKVTCEDGVEEAVCLVAPVLSEPAPSISSKCQKSGSSICHILSVLDIHSNQVNAVKPSSVSSKYVVTQIEDSLFLSLLPNNIERH